MVRPIPPVSDRAMRAWPHLGVGVEVTCDRVCINQVCMFTYCRVVLCCVFTFRVVSVFTFALCFFYFVVVSACLFLCIDPTP